MVTVDGAQIYLLDEGAGTPTLFLHGNPDSADLWLDVIARLKDKYRCLAIDLPGFGRSEVPANFEVSLDGYARFIDALVNAIGIKEPLNLVGHDFGAHFGLAWAIKHPNKVKYIAILNTSFFSDYQWHSLAKMLRTPILGDIMIRMTNAQNFANSVRSSSPKLSDEHFQHTMALYTPKARQMALKLYRSTDPKWFMGWQDDLLKLTAQVPTCVIWGDWDQFAPKEYAERFGAQKVYHFPDCGHWVAAEDPDGTAKDLEEFFES